MPCIAGDTVVVPTNIRLTGFSPSFFSHWNV